MMRSDCSKSLPKSVPWLTATTGMLVLAWMSSPRRWSRLQNMDVGRGEYHLLGIVAGVSGRVRANRDLVCTSAQRSLFT